MDWHSGRSNGLKRNKGAEVALERDKRVTAQSMIPQPPFPTAICTQRLTPGGQGRCQQLVAPGSSEPPASPVAAAAAARPCAVLEKPIQRWPGRRPSSRQEARVPGAPAQLSSQEFGAQCGQRRMENATAVPERANASGLDVMPRPPLAVQAVTLALVPLVCTVGVAGNGMVILVVVRSRHMVTPTNCYLVSLAAADLLVLLAAGVPAVAEVVARRVWVFGHAGCLGITYLQYVGINASTGSITAFTVERYLAICRPLRAQALCTVARAKRIAALVWLGTGAYCVLWLFLVDTREAAYADGVQVQCDYRVSRSLYLPVYFLDFALFYALPLGLAALLYTLIARALFVGPLPPGDPGRSGSVHQGGPPGQARFSSRARKGALNSRKQVTKMLAVVLVLFALLWLPYRTLVVVNSFLSPPYLNLGFLLFCRLCIYLNSAINPIVYTLMSQRFREAFHRLFRCRLARPRPPPQETLPVYYSAVKDCSRQGLGS
ncbi:thyrotropin-releasing hormone receptor-like [Tenrec ecaudatus]|uniref:thyrotropin-releasing hormone receptor-like n=1 Tax=Tenrec ecaudatus TaxID=94439 RepID=UPI003F5ACB0E